MKLFVALFLLCSVVFGQTLTENEQKNIQVKIQSLDVRILEKTKLVIEKTRLGFDTQAEETSLEFLIYLRKSLKQLLGQAPEIDTHEEHASEQDNQPQSEPVCEYLQRPVTSNHWLDFLRRRPHRHSGYIHWCFSHGREDKQTLDEIRESAHFDAVRLEEFIGDIQRCDRSCLFSCVEYKQPREKFDFTRRFYFFFHYCGKENYVTWVIEPKDDYLYKLVVNGSFLHNPSADMVLYRSKNGSDWYKLIEKYHYDIQKLAVGFLPDARWCILHEATTRWRGEYEKMDLDVEIELLRILDSWFMSMARLMTINELLHD